MNSNLITFLKENQQTCLTEKRTEVTLNLILILIYLLTFKFNSL